jgi:hypothetical protein
MSVGIPNRTSLLRRTRLLLALFSLALVASGLTAVPVVREVNILKNLVGPGTSVEKWFPAMAHWISLIHSGVTQTSREYPFLFYGYDWLAFGHIVIAIAVLGAIREPVRNVWVVEFAMIACLLVLPVALVGGHFRGIPVFWRLIDCSFGIVGIIPLAIAHRWIRLLEVPRQRAPAAAETQSPPC